MAFSDYIIYADESGSPILSADLKDFPVFLLVFLVVRKRHYAFELVPKVQMLKFDFVGHDQLILHERDIRRQANAFAFLQVSEEMRRTFIDRATAIIEAAEITLCCAIIDKKTLAERYSNPWSPYDLALAFCIARAARFLVSKGQDGTTITVAFEARGATEDRHLEKLFRSLSNGAALLGEPESSIRRMKWDSLFVDKRANSTGLQLADLAARPLGLSYLRPGQPNRAVKVLRSKLDWIAPMTFP